MIVRGLLRRAAVAAAGAAVPVALCSHSAIASCSTKEPDSPPPASFPENVFEPIRSAYDYASDLVYDNLIKPYAEPSRDKLLADRPAKLPPRPTLVLSLDGCLIESVWTRQHGWRYIKRPGLDEFLNKVSPFFEVVLWTDAMNTADPIVDRIDEKRRIHHRLYRDTTTFKGGHHRKDLSALNRDLKQTVIIDTSPEPFSLQPDNGILVNKYEHAADPEKKDDQLTKLIPFLQYLALVKVADFPAELKTYEGKDIGDAFKERLPELRAAGKLKVGRGPPGAAAEGRSTIWDRMRSR